MIYVPLALRLHSFGLARLQDPNWTGMTLYDHLKRYMRGRGEPKGVLFRTIDRGVLWLLGGRLFDELLDIERLRYELSEGEIKGEHLMWHVEDAAAFVASLSGHDLASVAAARNATDALDSLYAIDEDAYYDALGDEDRINELFTVYGTLLEANAEAIARVREYYAANYADRVFHDRQLCGFISQLILAIGIDGGLDDNQEPEQWIERLPWPEWTKAALRARERGKCALCDANLVLELEDDAHIDHIVPISRGGTNDLVNLQMLCAPCNRDKSNATVEVLSSIPPYLSRRLSR